MPWLLLYALVQALCFASRPAALFLALFAGAAVLPAGQVRRTTSKALQASEAPLGCACRPAEMSHQQGLYSMKTLVGTEHGRPWGHEPEILHVYCIACMVSHLRKTDQLGVYEGPLCLRPVHVMGVHARKCGELSVATHAAQFSARVRGSRLWDAWRRHFRLRAVTPPLPFLGAGRRVLCCQFPCASPQYFHLAFPPARRHAAAAVPGRRAPRAVLPVPVRLPPKTLKTITT